MVALDKRVLRGFDRVIAVSERIQKDLVDSGVPASKITLLHNAIVLDKYRRTAETGYLESLVGRSLPRPIAVSIGRLSPGERPRGSDRGSLDRRRTRPAHHDRARGDGIIARRSRRTDSTRGTRDWVHMPGYVNEPARVLQDADLMVLPSHTEGLPNAALEALAMEVPVLATNVGGTPEVITDGVTGRLVPARAPETLAAHIGDFLRDPQTWRAWAQRGKHTVETQFDFTLRTRKLEAIYVEMMESTQREAANSDTLEPASDEDPVAVAEPSVSAEDRRSAAELQPDSRGEHAR
jgi:glycosyltransferase involved in cell wall biosynthesis